MRGLILRASMMAISVSLVGGCASTTGVLPMGPDTYTISAGFAGSGSISGNSARAKRKALTDANEYCRKMGKEILVKNTGMNATAYGSTNEIIFQCLDKNDPAFSRPEYEREADVKVKVES